MIWLRAKAPSTSHPLPLPSPIVLLRTRAFVAMMRDAAPSTYILATRSEAPPSRKPPLLPILLPTPSPPLLFPSTDRRAVVHEVCLPPRKRLCFALGLRYEVGESSSAPTARPIGGFRADYGFVATLDGAPVTDETELGRRLTNFVTTKMAPKRATISTPAATATTTTTVTNDQLKEMIDQGVTNALAARDADRNTNGDDSHNSETGVRYLKKKMTDKYCLRGKIKKLEGKLWNLKVKGTDMIGYNQRFQELALLCVRMFPEEFGKIERYVGGLPDMIHGCLVASKPKTMQEAIEIAIELMDNKIRTFAER
ncbi:hypothetical protein Tco_1286251 [Tanacetum coccineum]